MSRAALDYLADFLGLRSAEPAVAQAPIRSVSTVHASDAVSNGGWYGRKAARRDAHGAAEAGRAAEKARERAEAERAWRRDRFRERAVTALVCTGIVAVMTAGVIHTVHLNRELAGWDPSRQAMHACQDGYSRAPCVAVRVGRGETRLVRLDTDGQLRAETGATPEGRLEIPVIRDGALSWSQARWTRGAKGALSVAMDLPTGVSVPFMAPDGSVALAPSAGRSLALDRAVPVTSGPVESLTTDGLLALATGPGASR